MDPSRVRVSGPLEPFAVGFAGELARLGFTANSAGLQLGVVAHLSLMETHPKSQRTERLPITRSRVRICTAFR